MFGRVGAGGLQAIKERQLQCGEPGKGSGGFHLVFFGSPQKRLSFVAEVNEGLYQLFQPGDHYIAQLELAMLLYGLVARPAEFRGRRGVWFVDNTAALMALIRGRSSSNDLSRLSQLIHLCLFALDCSLYWEWIPSKSNWADDISRLGRLGGHHSRAVLVVHWEECLGCVPQGSVTR